MFLKATVEDAHIHKQSQRVIFAFQIMMLTGAVKIRNYAKLAIAKESLYNFIVHI